MTTTQTTETFRNNTTILTGKTDDGRVTGLTVRGKVGSLNLSPGTLLVERTGDLIQYGVIEMDGHIRRGIRRDQMLRLVDGLL